MIRRLVSLLMVSVFVAGLASPARAEAPVQEPPKVELELRTPGPEYKVWMRGRGQRSPVALCAGACTELVTPGEYHFALSYADRPPREDPWWLSIRENVALEGSYRSRRTLRMAGGGLILLGVVGMFATMRAVHSLDKTECDSEYDGDCPDNEATFPNSDRIPRVMAGGLISSGLVMLAGLAMTLLRDRARFQAFTRKR
ncbi:MAG: hypothetical protein QM778_18860 [Myxococcales bacterium]